MTEEEIDAVAGRLAERLGRADASPYLDVRQAAAYCRCAVQTIYNNRRFIERMPGLRKLLFTREALDLWLATRRQRRSTKRRADDRGGVGHRVALRPGAPVPP